MISDIQQHEYMNKDLRLLLIWLEDKTGLTFTMTSQYRIDDDGVHGTLPLRGTDLRMRNYAIGYVIEAFINNHWQYDHARPNLNCCTLHGEGEALHLHIQVHKNTGLINGDK